MTKKIKNIRRPILRNPSFEAMDKLEKRRNLHKISNIGENMCSMGESGILNPGEFYLYCRISLWKGPVMHMILKQSFFKSTNPYLTFHKKWFIARFLKEKYRMNFKVFFQVHFSLKYEKH